STKRRLGGADYDPLQPLRRILHEALNSSSLNTRFPAQLMLHCELRQALKQPLLCANRKSFRRKTKFLVNGRLRYSSRPLLAAPVDALPRADFWVVENLLIGHF